MEVEVTPSKYKAAEQAQSSLIKAGRSYSRCGRMRVTERNQARFDAAAKRLHRAAERWALLLPPDAKGGAE